MWCWGSGTAGLYRPGCRPADSPSSWSNWKDELSLAESLPSNVTGGYTAGRMADIGSLCCGPKGVSQSGTVELERAPAL